MNYTAYHTGANPLIRDHRALGRYWVSHMCQGDWMYIVDDFGNGVPASKLNPWRSE